jgi:hypothetical protein
MSTEVKCGLTINGVEYVPKAAATNQKAESVDGLDYVIIRTQNAGVFAGYLKKKVDQEVVLKNARRLWYWSGAASLSQLATEGTSKPKDCKFPCEVSSVILNQVIEVIETTQKAKDSIASVAIWKA